MHILLVLLNLLSNLLLLITHGQLTVLRSDIVISDLKLTKAYRWIEVLNLLTLLRTFLKVARRCLIALYKLWVLDLNLVSQGVIKALLVEIWFSSTFRYWLWLWSVSIHIRFLDAHELLRRKISSNRRVVRLLSWILVQVWGIQTALRCVIYTIKILVHRAP